MIHFLTAVWGGHVQTYLDAVIPAQLSQGNLPSAGDCRYVIITTPNDRRIIENAPIFQILSRTVFVGFEVMADDNLSRHKRATKYLCRGINEANAARAPCVFLCPDIVFADGAFAAVRRIGKKHDAIFIVVLRTLKDGVTTSLKGGETPRELMRVAFANLHPLAHCSFWEEGGDNFIPANIYWRIGDQGILARCYHLHPLFVRPQSPTTTFRGTIDDAYCDVVCPDPRRDYVVTDSDELCAIELSDPSHYFTTKYRKGEPRDVAAWARNYANRRHRQLFERTIKLHTGITDVTAWEQAAYKADNVARKIRKWL